MLMRFLKNPFPLRSALLALCGAALLAGPVAAQTAEPAPPPPATADTPPQPAPKYAARDIERAFGYIDANQDGRLSREEAAGFRGVARHFDEADLNHDGALSRAEFENALNHSKPQ
ncbi:EF-hand domain-containing protein [Polaromonas sp.]|uniref:EF-hand domain-containing protein n=1 Tax=Polaromonas sp. TaxID=1869339 RepID=UPI00286C7C99|nr:EF-hand domain-containing protein [Polaromonas sp.]